MKSTPVLFVLFVSLCLLGSCKKTELTGEYSDYVGEWYGFDIYMSFTPDGRADYSSDDDEFASSLENARVIIEGNTLKLKKGVVTQEFVINQHPTETSPGEWQMRLNHNKILNRY